MANALAVSLATAAWESEIGWAAHATQADQGM
jgi:hypothetical protein